MMFERMVVRQLEKSDLNAPILILRILSLTPLFYGILVFILPVDDGTSTSNIPVDLLAIVFTIGSALVVVATFKFLVPSIDKTENFNKVFPIMLITLVLTEVIAIFGLIIGIIDILILYQEPSWNIIGGFLLVSAVLMFYLTQNRFIPKMNSLLGTEFKSSG